MSENVMLMRKAKAQLSGKWVSAAVATLIYVVLQSVASFTYLGELILVGPLTFGYYLFLACLVDTHQSNLNLLFKGFERFADTLVAGLLYSLAVGIGFCLLIVPGIIAACGLGLTFFIMVDQPEISGVDALQKSWNLMRGHKWEFFCLNIRFIGWVLLSIITLGIGFLFLNPYIIVTQQNFYRKLRYGTY